MVNKFEAYGIAVSIGLMVLALWMLRVHNTEEKLAAVTNTEQSASVYVAGDDISRSAVADAVVDASDASGNLEKLIINDITIGTGEEVVEGDTVTVDYIGTLQNGQEFDNSYRKGASFTFEVGKGRVIDGWDQGILGMREGGKRILVIPYGMAYGVDGYGPIPPRANLVFALELHSVEKK